MCCHRYCASLQRHGFSRTQNAHPVLTAWGHCRDLWRTRLQAQSIIIFHQYCVSYLGIPRLFGSSIELIPIHIANFCLWFPRRFYGVVWRRTITGDFIGENSVQCEMIVLSQSACLSWFGKLLEKEKKKNLKEMSTKIAALQLIKSLLLVMTFWAVFSRFPIHVHSKHFITVLSVKEQNW